MSKAKFTLSQVRAAHVKRCLTEFISTQKGSQASEKYVALRAKARDVLAKAINSAKTATARDGAVKRYTAAKLRIARKILGK